MDLFKLFKAMAALMLCQYIDDVFSLPQKDSVFEFFNQAPKTISTEIQQILKPFRNLQFGFQRLFPAQHVLIPSNEVTLKTENALSHSYSTKYTRNKGMPEDPEVQLKYYNYTEINTVNTPNTTEEYKKIEIADVGGITSTNNTLTRDKSVNYLGNDGFDVSTEVTSIETTEINESTTDNNDIFDKIGVPPEVLASLVG